MAGSPPPGPQGYPPQQGGYQQQPQQHYPPQQGGYPPPGGQPGYNPAAPYGVHPRSGIPYSDKQKMTAGLLQIFLGGFGVGRFYTGHTGLAIAQIAVTWLTCGIGGIWPFIDGIMMLTGDDVTDIDGRPLRPN
jgi:TM2 domain-containing membrane protein YozV